MKTELLAPDPAGIARAAALLAEGALVALPTETVYGLGADARNGTACARIFAAKGRPRFNPLIVHVADLVEAERLAEFTPEMRALATAFWPGPLTLVVPLRAGHGLSPLVSAGLDTVALRVPAHPVMRAVMAAFEGPIAAPSANPSGRISPTRAAHVLAGLEGQIAAVLDGGDCAIGLESTILGGAPLGVLREGGLAREKIEATLPGPLISATTPGKITAPGQLSSHYAPSFPVRLEATSARPGEILIGFGAVSGALSLSPSGDLIQAAATLFDALHRAQTLARAQQATAIAVAPVPDTGLGRAINDRLRRAAAP